MYTGDFERVSDARTECSKRMSQIFIFPFRIYVSPLIFLDMNIMSRQRVDTSVPFQKKKLVGRWAKTTSILSHPVWKML